MNVHVGTVNTSHDVSSLLVGKPLKIYSELTNDEDILSSCLPKYDCTPAIHRCTIYCKMMNDRFIGSNGHYAIHCSKRASENLFISHT